MATTVLPLAVLLVLVVVLAVVGLAVAASALPAGSRAPAGGPSSSRLAVVARTTALSRAAGFAAGLVVAGVSLREGALGRGVLLAAPLCGFCVLVGVVLGESQIRAPSGPTRAAVLEVRRVRHYLPRALTVAVAAAGLLLLALLAFTTAAASPDGLGHAGRALARSCSPTTFQTQGPWPGLFYSLPLTAVLLVGLVTAALALRRVVHRPRQDGPIDVDDALRRSASTAVMAAAGLLVAAPLAGISAVSAPALLAACNPPPAWTTIGWALLALLPVVLGLCAWCVGLLVLPSPLSAGAPGRGGVAVASGL